MKRSNLLLTAGAVVLGLTLGGTALAFRFSEDPGAVVFTSPSTVELQAEGQAAKVLNPKPGEKLTFSLGSFRRLSTTGAWKVTLVSGPPGTGTLTVPTSGTFHITALVNGGELRLLVEDLPGSAYWGSPVRPELEVCIPDLQRVTSSGSSEMDLGGLHGDKLAIELSGSSTLSGTGTLGTLDLQTTGASNVDLGRLSAGTILVAGSGAGNLVVRTNGRVDGYLSGAVNLRVLGNPSAVEVSASGQSAVTRD